MKAKEEGISKFEDEIGHATHGEEMETNDAHAQHDKDFYKAFYRISDKVDQLFAYYQERLEKKENKKVKIEGDP